MHFLFFQYAKYALKATNIINYTSSTAGYLSCLFAAKHEPAFL